VKIVLKEVGPLNMASEAVFSSPRARAGGPAAMVLTGEEERGRRKRLSFASREDAVKEHGKEKITEESSNRVDRVD